MDAAVAAVGAALDGRELSRDDLHAALRESLPASMLPWCEGCQSRHARRGLLVMAALHGRLCIAGKAGRQPRFTRTDQWLGAWKPPAPADAAAALVRRHLRAFGPSSPGDFAKWAGIGTQHARSVWSAVDGELVEVQIDDGPKRWLLAPDVDALEHAPQLDGVVLLGPGDPLLQLGDRAVLVPDRSVHKVLWAAIPTVGLVLSDGQPMATWRAKKRGKVLEVSLTQLMKVPSASKQAVQAAVERVAPHRGCISASVSWTG